MVFKAWRAPVILAVVLQVGMLQGTATALALSVFRRGRARVEQRRQQQQQRASGDLLDPRARFAHVVQVSTTSSQPDAD